MRFAFLMMGLFTTLASAHADVRVVSDIDDTVKVTNVGSKWPAVWNGLFTARAFAGMRELYQSMAQGRRYRFEYLSGSPTALRPRIQRFLWLNGFPTGNLTLKTPFQSETTHEYKSRVLLELLAKYPDDQFILIGDDTQADVDAYDGLFRIYPGRILAIYIRKVVNDRLPPSIYPFLTAFEIARTEYFMGRMTVEQASPVALAILGEPREKRVFPSFAFCPTKKEYFFFADLMEEWNAQIEERTQEICGKRHLPVEG